LQRRRLLVISLPGPLQGQPVACAVRLNGSYDVLVAGVDRGDSSDTVGARSSDFDRPAAA